MVSGFRGSGVYGFRGSRVHGFRVSGFQGFRVLGFQGLGFCVQGSGYLFKGGAQKRPKCHEG